MEWRIEEFGFFFVIYYGEEMIKICEDYQSAQAEMMVMRALVSGPDNTDET